MSLPKFFDLAAIFFELFSPNLRLISCKQKIGCAEVWGQLGLPVGELCGAIKELLHYELQETISVVG